MGMNTVLPNRNSFEQRERAQSLATSSIQRARVSEVHISRGTVSLNMESTSAPAEALFPLLGLSAPLEGDSANYNKASWGRYIPQVGDMVLVGIAPNRKVHILGYSAVYYKDFDIQDEDNVDIGGIGWGTVAGREVKPGDWDFKASRGSYLYLGDRAVIGSTSCKSTYNQSTNDITNTALIIVNNASASDIRYGAVRRKQLPTDQEESLIISSRGTAAQEYTAATRWNPGTGPIDLAYISQGDVVEEVGGASFIKLSPSGLPTRRWEYSQDVTGLLTTHDKVIDSNGNSFVTAALASVWSFSTPLAAWSITNLSTTINSSGTASHTSGGAFSITAPTVTATAATSASILSPMVSLGNTVGSLPFVKVTPTLSAAWSTYFTAAAAAWTKLSTNPTVSPDPATVAIYTTAAAGATAMVGALASSATLQVKGV